MKLQIKPKKIHGRKYVAILMLHQIWIGVPLESLKKMRNSLKSNAKMYRSNVVILSDKVDSDNISNVDVPGTSAAVVCDTPTLPESTADVEDAAITVHTPSRPRISELPVTSSFKRTKLGSNKEFSEKQSLRRTGGMKGEIYEIYKGTWKGWAKEEYLKQSHGTMEDTTIQEEKKGTEETIAGRSGGRSEGDEYKRLVIQNHKQEGVEENYTAMGLKWPALSA
ncbi:hypothetical protein FQA39_LY03391 [Lamprigera yunnana]|nr:hypothetical protein FQA39_LY03391 [Lamprigera yunnana]